MKRELSGRLCASSGSCGKKTGRHTKSEEHRPRENCCEKLHEHVLVPSGQGDEIRREGGGEQLPKSQEPELECI